jgi:hypothetical protein
MLLLGVLYDQLMQFRGDFFNLFYSVVILEKRRFVGAGN